MAHFEDCKFFLRDSCLYGPNCFFRHSELACMTVEVCMPWASGYVCDGRCNLRHPSVAELNFIHQHDSSPEEENTASVAAVAPRCVFFLQGRCSKGSACPFSHAAVAIDENGPRSSADEPKVPPPGGRQRSAAVAEGAQPREATASAPVCRFFAKGRCTKGSSCLFAHETPLPKEQSADVKVKAANILERHRLSKRSRVEANKPKNGDAPPKRQRSSESSVERGAARVSVDRPGRTKRQRSPEKLFSAACVEDERATKVSRSANSMDGQGGVATSATTSSPTPSPLSPHTTPPAAIST